MGARSAASNARECRTFPASQRKTVWILVYFPASTSGVTDASPAPVNRKADHATDRTGAPSVIVTAVYGRPVRRSVGCCARARRPVGGRILPEHSDTRQASNATTRHGSKLAGIPGGYPNLARAAGRPKITAGSMPGPGEAVGDQRLPH